MSFAFGVSNLDIVCLFSVCLGVRFWSCVCAVYGGMVPDPACVTSCVCAVCGSTVSGIPGVEIDASERREGAEAEIGSRGPQVTSVRPTCLCDARY